MNIAANRILDKAEGMFFKFGIKSVTMDDIARELGMSKKTLYTHYENKQTIVDEVTAHHIKTEKAVISQIREEASDSVEEILMIARFILQMLRKMTPTVIYDLRKYYHGCWQRMDNFHRQYVYEVISTNLKKGIEAGLYRKSIKPEIIGKLYAAQTMMITDEDLFPLEEFTRAELYTQLVRYHLQGIITADGQIKLDQYQKTIQKI